MLDDVKQLFIVVTGQAIGVFIVDVIYLEFAVPCDDRERVTACRKGQRILVGDDMARQVEIADRKADVRVIEGEGEIKLPLFIVRQPCALDLRVLRQNFPLQLGSQSFEPDFYGVFLHVEQLRG